MQNALKMVDESENGSQTSGKRLDRYLEQKTLEPFIYKEKDRSMFLPLTCYKGGSKINGYNAEILADICEAFLDARNNIKLAPLPEVAFYDYSHNLIRTSNFLLYLNYQKFMKVHIVPDHRYKIKYRKV